MGGAIRRLWFLAVSFLLLSLAGWMSPAAMAQQGTATINGVVKDPTGAAIPNARVELTNVGTSVVRSTSTNSDGAYAFPSVVPGSYTMQASSTGFSTVTQHATTLEVGQTATFDFQLTVGTAQQNVTVNAAEGATLETATSELGTVVNTKEVTDLPLNGRNFTQLLTVTAGVANINRDQSASGGSGWAGNSLGSFTFPAVNGARNRSNYFILDGANDLNTMLGMYNYAPIVDAIQEFKTQGHNDLAEYGGAAGGIVSVVTKSGTNQFHGALWEFLRNADMDARGYFESTLPPLKQNQYGASVGGPVWIPKVYNGKNKTFFYAAFEGFQIRSAITTGSLAPTAAERSGDFSALGVPIYDPLTTTLNPATGTYSRTAFPGNIIPANRISPISALFQTLIPAAGPLVNGNNVYSSGPASTSQNSGTARGDQNFGNNNQLSFRFSDFGQNVANTSNVVGLNTIYVHGYNYVGHWTHTFSPTTFSDVYFGRNFGVTTTGTGFPGETPAFLSQLQTLGMSTSWMTLNNKLYAPQWTADNYLSLSGSQLQQTGLADNWQWGGAFTKIIGKHTIKGGGDFQSNNFRSPIAYSSAAFGTAQTAGLGADQGQGGNAWASLLLGVPREASYRNILEVAGGGWIDGIFAQDQFKATSRLTINVGFRNDFVWTPIYGTGNGANFYTGNANPLTGQYELNALPPNCSATQGAPCIPAGIYTASTTPAPGGLPANAYVNPASDHRVIKNSLFDWAGRLGLAYRLGDKMVIRSSYSRFYDAWATTVQLSQNFGGNWPAVNTLDNAGLNVNVPTAPARDPLGLGSGGAIIYPINDFSQVSQWMVDPNFRTPYMDQWNVGIERELPANAVLDVNYVGSVGRHLDWGPIMNTPPPGPGPVQARRPYPYMLQQWFDQSVGNSRYNALQVTLNKRTSHGVTFLVAYTLSHSNDDGCGLGANCNSTQPYNRSADYGTSDTNQEQAFSAAFTLQSPFTTSSNKWVSNLAGGWALNGIAQIASGWPYTITNSGDPENVGSISQERVNVVGNPNSGSGLKTPAHWFNVNAFAIQAPYTYGNEKVNPLTSDGTKNLDLSLFRSFHVGLGESRYFEFRAESFNLFNRVMFSIPNSALGGANFGAVTGSSNNGGQQNQPRQLQLALKFIY
jgi:hypothetical protein